MTDSKKHNSEVTPQTHIKVRGARANNLKNVDIDIPKNELVVITGLSGSGKSSLAFDTIYAEGQRRYVESLSAYARQFLGLMEKPDVDMIEGLSPAISIDQKSAGHNPRSTVGTVTEIYDYLRLLFARVGHPRSTITGKRLQKQSVQQIVDDILNYPEKHAAEAVKIQVLAPIIKNRKGTYEELFQRFLSQGYVRVRIDGEVFNLEEDIKLDRFKKHTIDLIIDRLVVEKGKKDDPEFHKRLTDSVELALNMGESELLINLIEGNEDIFYSENLVDPETGVSFPEVEPHSFSFNSPHGACATCAGLGIIKEIDPSNIYNPRLTISEGGIYPWSRMADNMNSWHMQLLGQVADAEGFSLRTKLGELEEKHLQTILYGSGDKKYNFKYQSENTGASFAHNTKFEGVIPNLLRRYEQTESDYIRREIEQYMTEKECPECNGLRLRRESLTVTIGGLNIVDVTNLPISETLAWVQSLNDPQAKFKAEKTNLTEMFDFPVIDPEEDALTEQEKEIGKQVFKEINARLNFLISVGLDYLTLSRKANTLSGGESQRIRLASQIGTGLTGVLYVLDEPSIGLHQRDNARLIETLKNLRDLDNTVLVVEHDEDTIRTAGYVIDIGPGAGEHGGQIVTAGELDDILENKESITAQYLNREKVISRESISKDLAEIGIENGRHKNKEKVQISGITHHNLKGIDVEVPLGKLVAVTGVSGSGKSSFVNEVLYRAIARELYGSKDLPGAYKELRGIEHVDKVIDIDQSPIGRTPRSNPATYTGVFGPIRDIFAQTKEAKSRGYKPGRFSFNVKGGRCEHCQGDGLIKIEMQFLPDVYVTCEVCKGKRYNRETLQIDFKGKNIAEVLDMTVEEALAFFENVPTIQNKLQTLNDVGLGYIRLGQSATTLSGGEAQRVKLASELSKRQTGKTLYILDEPTT
ncbi:excinuclease ABC subunit UvrA, partial [Candidatus Dojkabacteria bacterium]|nr:excinuclease ABC subunit UvrA [Candidatus Dojkabacteria bacterium]